MAKEIAERFTTALEMLAEHAEIETALADPGVHSDPNRARQLRKRY